MTESDARQELERDTSASSEPVLDAGDINQLLTSWLASAPSSASAADGSWYLNRAKAAGWRVKAGRYAVRADFEADGRKFKASQTPAFFLEMAGAYDRLADLAGEPRDVNADEEAPAGYAVQVEAF